MPVFLAFLTFLILLVHPAHAESTAEMQKYLADPASYAELGEDADKVRAFYALRKFKPAWNFSDEESLKRAQSFLDSFDELITYHGLYRGDYPVAALRKLAKDTDNAEKMELLTAQGLLRLARDLRGDGIDLDELYIGWNFHKPPMNLAATLNAAVNNGKIDDYFNNLPPKDRAYSELATALKTYREIESKGGWKQIAHGPTLRPGDTDARVKSLRERLAAEGYLPPEATESEEFDTALAAALTEYQKRNGLAADGQLGGRTLEALNMSVTARIDQIRANMERWRQMPEDFPPATFTMVNIPDFSVTIWRDGKSVYSGSVVVGRADRMTPFINSAVANVMINPPWNVPRNLARKDILPKLWHDPYYLEKQGIEIVGRTEDPSGTEIDWQALSGNRFPYRLRQRPGDLNSLGQLKLNFANAFDVYMHGTPHQELFGKAARAYSSGCVRMEEPAKVVEVILDGNKGGKPWTVERIQDEISAGKTKAVVLKQPMPVYFLYWTVFTDSEGKVNFRKDLYGYDTKLMKEMRKVPQPPAPKLATEADKS